MSKDEVVAKAIKEAFGIDDHGKAYLEYLGMTIGGEATNDWVPRDNVCAALRDVASAIRELAAAVEGRDGA